MPAKWLSENDAERILTEGFSGRLATSVDGYPYIVSLNYCFLDGAIYFHSRVTGRKLENIKRNPQVCFEVSNIRKLVKNKKPCDFGVRFESVLAFGSAKILDDEEKKMKAVQHLIAKYAGDMTCEDITLQQLNSIAVVEITIDKIEAKQNVDPEEL